MHECFLDSLPPPPQPVGAGTVRNGLVGCVAAAALLAAGCGSDSPATAPPPPAPPAPTPGVTVSLASLTVGEGSEATYTVVLDSQPAGAVTVTPSSADAGAVSVSGPLTFTVGNWSVAQTVTVTAEEEDNADTADESVGISHAVSGYGSVTSAADVQVTVSDDDVVANGIYGSMSSLWRADAANEETWEANAETREAGGAVDGWVSGGVAILLDGALLVELALPGAEIVNTDDSGLETRTYIRPSSYTLSATYALDGERISASNDSLSEGIEETVTGTVAVGESLDIVLARTGVADSEAEYRFSMEYGAHYDRPSSLSQWEGTWVTSAGGVSLINITVDAGGAFFGQFPAIGCVFSGSLSIIDTGRNLMNLELISESCDEADVNGRYTGVAYLDDADNYIDVDVGEGFVLDVPGGGANNIGLFFAVRDAVSLVVPVVRQ